MTSIRSWAPDHTSTGEVTLLSLGNKSQLLVYRFMVMTKENPAPKAKPIISKKAIIVPAVSACFGSTVLGKRERERKKKHVIKMHFPLWWTRYFDRNPIHGQQYYSKDSKKLSALLAWAKNLQYACWNLATTICTGFSKLASCPRKSPPTWLVSPSYSAPHFLMDGVF